MAERKRPLVAGHFCGLTPIYDIEPNQREKFRNKKSFNKFFFKKTENKSSV
jgi:hypothetical protein